MCRTKILFAIIGCFLAESNCHERISDGQAAEIHEFPFATALLTNGGMGEFTHRCGGSIISNTAILSAASCFHTNNELNPASWWRARVGSTYSNTGGLVYFIRLIMPHPSFNVTTRDVDLAVLRTAQPMEQQPGAVEAAFLAGGSITLAPMDRVRAIGWGATTAIESEFSPQLNQVEIFVVDQERCASRYAEVGFTVTNNMVCAAWIDVADRAQCQGDNGSPLLNSEGAIVGVHSWTEGCAQDWHPSINTRVTAFIRWIVNMATA